MICTSFPTAWVINLARSADRRIYINDHLRSLNLPFEIVEAVDGLTLTADELAGVYDPALAATFGGRELTVGEIGCALSHLRLYQRMVDEHIEEAFILEDDAVIHPGILELLARRGEWPNDWEILLMHHLPWIGGQLNWWHTRFVGAHRFGRFSRPTYGTAGYLIRQSAAQSLIRQAYPVRIPADHWTGGAVSAGIQIYGVEPPCIEQLPMSSPEDTTIPGREAYRKKWGMREFPTDGFYLYLHRLASWLVNVYCKYHPARVVGCDSK